MSSADSSRLAEALKLQLRSRAIAPPSDEILDFAAAFARMLIRGTAAGWEEYNRRRDDIVAQVVLHGQVPLLVAAALVELAESPEFRGFVEPAEREAFRRRFGEVGWRRLQAQISGMVDLAGFSERYGTDATLRLVDAMLAVVTEEGSIRNAELRRVEAVAGELGVDPSIVCHLLRRHAPGHQSGLSWPLATRLRIGHSPTADVVLVDPQPGALRAELIEEDDGFYLRDTGSGRPTLLNGQPVERAPVQDGDEIRIGSYTLRVDLKKRILTGKSDWEIAPLSARGLSRKIGELRLLDDLSFTLFRGEVVAVVGPSGAGKTTLLQAIAGIAPANHGEVRYDGRDFHELLKKDRSLVGMVPQDDIVHPELEVEESLRFGGRLRLPAGTAPAALQAEVERVLEELNIGHIRHNRIGDALRRGISGGQRKRVNLGQELLTRSTRVLFLDEPTSGLDPRSAQDIVRLIRQLADRGRIVLLVTHDLSPQVMAQVDHLMVLAPGGRLAWFGPPREACRYFGVETADAIFHRFHEKTPEEWSEAYRKSSAHRSYVELRQRLLARNERGGAAPAPPPPPSILGHTAALIARYGRVKSRDRSGNLVLFAQPPVLGAVMAIVFPQATAPMMFVLSLSCLWFGMSAAVRELIADRVVWNRERRAGVSSISYVASKVVVLAGLTFVQCFALTTMVWLTHRLGDYSFDYLPLLGITGLTGLVGMSLGLAISALFSSSEGAVGTLPLLLIPQIAFSGLLVNLRNMTETARLLCWLNPQRYAYDAILKVGVKIAEQPRYGGPWQDPVGVTGVLYELGFKGSSEADMGLPLPVLAGVLAGISVFFLGVTQLAVYRRS